MNEASNRWIHAWWPHSLFQCARVIGTVMHTLQHVAPDSDAYGSQTLCSLGLPNASVSNQSGNAMCFICRSAARDMDVQNTQFTFLVPRWVNSVPAATLARGVLLLPPLLRPGNMSRQPKMGRHRRHRRKPKLQPHIAIRVQRAIIRCTGRDATENASTRKISWLRESRYYVVAVGAHTRSQQAGAGPHTHVVHAHTPLGASAGDSPTGGWGLRR
ncbi:hypothetical protein CTheo_1662 [Ceratobasidium theobromae]|uniref:Uncharacterized protein n=1 Tax=Ceratobasidium theobromae TaxID=1582974 RepID=A0A5N5QUG2_9AGAM|nr:hypothetical protein CTheo_1662 [Ceratobasidium theobromae]